MRINNYYPTLGKMLVCCVMLLIVWTNPALAHNGDEHLHAGLLSGLAHQIFGMGHILAMITGLLLAMLSRRA